MNSTPFPPHARRWLWLGVFSLIASGIPAIGVLVGRTTGLTAEDALTRYFREALAIHVDLSVLVWFLVAAFMMWSVEAARRPKWAHVPYLEEAAWWSIAVGAAVMVISPLAAEGEGLISNYIPVINNLPFFFGLSLIICGGWFMVARLLFCKPNLKEGDTAKLSFSVGTWSAGLITAVALSTFDLSYLLIPDVFEGTQYYDLVFWAGGHLLQFTHTQMLLVAWILMAAALVPAFAMPRWLVYALFGIGVFAVALTPYPFLAYGMEQMEFRMYFTTLMIHMNGTAPTLLAVVVAAFLFKSWNTPPELKAVKVALIGSIILFLYGGFLGLMIQGQNVIIPAHYHGSIVAITVAFMGLVYLWLPRLGGKAIAHTKLAFAQPIMLTVGQIMHVAGLAYLGGHGVPRKTPGMPELQGAETVVQVMRLGGALAILGGILFIVLVYYSLRSGAKEAKAA